MQGTVRFVSILIFAMLASTVVNTVMMELHVIPKQAATRTGVVESEVANNSTPFKPDRQDVQFSDFWYVDNVPSDSGGFITSVDATNGKYQVRFPMGI